MVSDDDYELVGLKPLDPKISLTAGAISLRLGLLARLKMTKVG